MHQSLALVSALGLLGSACTHTHYLPPGSPAEATTVDHVRGAGEGAGIGLLVGAVGGGTAVYAAAGEDSCNGPCLVGRADVAVLGGLVLGAGGALIGAVIGGATGSTNVYVESRLAPRLSVTGGGGGATAAAGWSF